MNFLYKFILSKTVLFLAIFLLCEWLIYQVNSFYLKRIGQSGYAMPQSEHLYPMLPKWLATASIERMLLALFLILGYESIILVFCALKIASYIKPGLSEGTLKTNNFLIKNLFSILVALIYKKSFWWLVPHAIYTFYRG